MNDRSADGPSRNLLDRVHAVLEPDRSVREVHMFGVTAVMINDVMALAVTKDGNLFVRVDPTEAPALLTGSDVSPARMGSGRPMSAGWICVGPAGTRSPDDLGRWVDRADSRLAGPTRRTG